MPKAGKKGKKQQKRDELAAIPLEEQISGTLDKYCGNGFKPRYFQLSRGLLKYFREEPTESTPQEGIAITWVHALQEEFDHKGLEQDSKREFQFQHQEHLFRLRAETPELRQKWLAHLTQLVKHVGKSQYIHGSVVQTVEAGSAAGAREFAYLKDGALVLCKSPLPIASLDFPKSAGGGEPARGVTASAWLGLGFGV